MQAGVKFSVVYFEKALFVGVFAEFTNFSAQQTVNAAVKIVGKRFLCAVSGSALNLNFHLQLVSYPSACSIWFSNSYCTNESKFISEASQDSA